jgi:hypothetical protein
MKCNIVYVRPMQVVSQYKTAPSEYQVKRIYYIPGMTVARLLDESVSDG